MSKIYNYILKLIIPTGFGYKAKLGGINAKALILIRWIAFAGQLITIMMVEFILQYPLELYYCLATILLLGISNLLIGMNYPRHGKLKNRHAAFIMAFDTLQLSILIYLTGGLYNPFALLILVPVTVSATMLSRSAVIIIAILSISTISFLSNFYLPLKLDSNIYNIDGFYIIGLWVALVVAVIFTATYFWFLAEEARRNIDALSATESALSREQSLSSLGSLAAAAAHELGSPLAVIAVVAKEISNEIDDDSQFSDDIKLLLSQTARCRDILKNMSMRPNDHGEMEFSKILLGELISKAAANHIPENIQLNIKIDKNSIGREPIITRKLEIGHALANIIQNAGQFANKTVIINLFWDDKRIIVTIKDDGYGFTTNILNNLGKPYISSRNNTGQHMGLGVFIAQNLLERVGASISYRNRIDDTTGAEITIKWWHINLENNKNNNIGFNINE